MNNLAYRGKESTTYKLVLLGFLTATLMLVLDKITGAEWTTGALGMLATYALKQTGHAFAEAMKDNKGG